MEQQDIAYMRRALTLAARGAGWVSPNPQVGAVIVRDGHIIGEGWHHTCGEVHAERDALRDCTARGEDASGATVYVTLEPCCHTGKQPPCTDALIEANVAEVVVGAGDPNPLVAGRGLALLREAGIRVREGVLAEECAALNHAWSFFITRKRPYLTMKYAMTLDGKSATHTGDSKWITGTEARAHVHDERTRVGGIMVGVGTVLADDPLLTARPQNWETEPHQPARIVLDAQARTPLASQLVRTACNSPVHVFTGPDAPANRIDALRDAGVQIHTVPAQNGQLDLAEVMTQLGTLGVDSLIVEGGGSLHGSLLASGLVNRVQAYIAPKLAGGAASPTPVQGGGIPAMDCALQLKNPQVTQLGADLLVEGEVN